ncbi:hypothetical protein CEQ21_16090 [Niallia circulans]|uniref:Uncharacterized protein n=1 Tax=Niallia circulans TaxID=1397 RepID=A0A553SJ49_NIACI|nr:hypothetical protein [Niallia circulans]TRZ37013.1 hypothetical protein CEQ21_16090 [Niallia circulans]
MESNNRDDFYTMVCDLYEEGILRADINWTDPIKVRDKIITSQRKTISFYIFEENNTLCLFGGSESQIAYAISKIVSFFTIRIKKINIFHSFKEYLNESKEFNGFQLTSVDIAKLQTGYDDSTYSNIPVKDMPVRVLTNHLNHSDIVSLVLYTKMEQIYFVLDLNSVVSFFDTDGDNCIFETCKRIVANVI